MSIFLDSNVLLYAISADDKKAAVASGLIRPGCTVSVQVLNEFANVACKKHRLPWPEISLTLAAFRRVLTVSPLTVDVHELALSIAERYRFSFYDSLLLAAALQANCTIFHSEDLQNGQVIDGQLTIRNPFA